MIRYDCELDKMAEKGEMTEDNSRELIKGIIIDYKKTDGGRRKKVIRGGQWGRVASTNTEISDCRKIVERIDTDNINRLDRT